MLFKGRLQRGWCQSKSCFWSPTGVYFVTNYLGLYSVKVISTEIYMLECQSKSCFCSPLPSSRNGFVLLASNRTTQEWERDIRLTNAWVDMKPWVEIRVMRPPIICYVFPHPPSLSSLFIAHAVRNPSSFSLWIDGSGGSFTCRPLSPALLTCKLRGSRFSLLTCNQLGCHCLPLVILGVSVDRAKQ